MARHYSTRGFFRQVANALLTRYFADRGLFEDLYFAAMKETKPDTLFASWLYLPDDQRKAMDAEFQEIFELNCDKDFRATIDEARWQMQADPEGLAAFCRSPYQGFYHSEPEKCNFPIRHFNGLPSSIMSMHACRINKKHVPQNAVLVRCPLTGSGLRFGMIRSRQIYRDAMMKASKFFFLSGVICFTFFSEISAQSLPPGCMMMNGEIRCIERRGKPTPKWQQDLQQKQALGKNCHQWIDIYRKKPSSQNKVYRDMACSRYSKKRIHLDDQVYEIFYGTPPRK